MLIDCITNNANQDPIELSAIASTFGASAAPDSPVYVGSIEPNVGHTEGCAGLAGVLRAIVSLEKGIILPTANIEKLDPKLKFKDWHLALPNGSIPWPSQGIAGSVSTASDLVVRMRTSFWMMPITT